MSDIRELQLGDWVRYHGKWWVVRAVYCDAMCKLGRTDLFGRRMQTIAATALVERAEELRPPTVSWPRTT